MFYCFVSVEARNSSTRQCYNGHEDVVKLLLEQQAVNVDARDEVRVHYGNISIVS